MVTRENVARTEDDPLPRFCAVYEALSAERRWFRAAMPLRFAAVTAIGCPGPATRVAAAIRAKANDIKAQAGWLGSLNSNLRFLLGAMLQLHHDTAARFVKEVQRVRKMFREAGLRRAQAYETIAIMILRVQSHSRPVSKATITKFRAVYEEMKRFHWWLTGPEDFPVCAMLAGEGAAPRQIARDIETIYQALHRERFWRGNPLQTAANMLYLAEDSPEVVAKRYRKLADGFRDAGVRIWQSDYDELAILAFLDHRVDRVVSHVLDLRRAITKLRPKPNRGFTFNLASSVAFLDLARRNKRWTVVVKAKALMDMQAVIKAQRANAAGAAAAS